ncbi:MAG: recombinase family protein [Thermomicrobiales bacterium]
MSPFEALLQLESAKAANVHRRSGTGSAVIYLRVSTQRQMNTASDVDPEGNSIATQREATVARARKLGAPIAEEFVEPGHSAQSIGKRKEFMRMIRYLDANPEVRYVIIYIRSRIFRNFNDATLTESILASLGITLISVKEDFGEGPTADVVKGVVDLMNHLQVRQGGEDISAKMRHKAMNGGTTGLAPLGYRNVPKEVDGRFINGITIDPKRAPLITWAFAEYATGEYSLVRLQDALTELGLTTRRTPKRGERPVSRQQLAKILRDPYYIGMVRYKGDVYPGRHEPLIAPDVYERVQQVMDARMQRNQRDIVHNHFLRGMMQCGRCAAEGRSRQLIYSQATNARGDQYEYYLCAGRQDGTCDLPHLPVQLVEAAVRQEVQALRLTPETVETMRRAEQAHLEDRLAVERDARKRIKRELADLGGKEERLLDLVADGTLDTDKVRERLAKLQVQREGLSQRLETTDVFLQQESDTLLAYLRLLERPGAFYTAAKDTVRRKLLRAYFRQIWIDDDGHQVRSTAQRQPMVAQIEAAAQTERGNERTTEHVLGGSSLLDRGPNQKAVCSSSNTLVPSKGLEPLASCSEVLFVGVGWCFGVVYRVEKSPPYQRFSPSRAI